MKKQISLAIIFFFFSTFILGPTFATEKATNITKEQATEIQNKICKDFLTLADQVKNFSSEEVKNHLETINVQIDSYIKDGEMTEKDGKNVKASLHAFEGKTGEELAKFYKESANGLQTLNVLDFFNVLSTIMVIGGGGLFVLVISATHGHATNSLGNKIILGCIGSVIGGILLAALIN